MLLAVLIYAILVEAFHSFLNATESIFSTAGGFLALDFSGIFEILLILGIIFTVIPLIFNTVLLHIAMLILKFKKRSIAKAFLATLTGTILGFLVGSLFSAMLGPIGFILIVFVYL